MPQAAFAALPEDELTASRALELRSADLLTEARAAADRDDWDLVEKILARARAQAGDNEWVARSIEELQKYALLRDPRFSKEAYFLARKKNLRLAEPGEDGPYSLLEETLKPGYVRRKLRQGKDLRGEPFGS
jgi:hypothetical protein